MARVRSMIWISLAILVAIPFLGLLGIRLFQPPPRALGLGPDGRFADLGPKPNWVSSDTADTKHHVPPLPAPTPSAFELLVMQAEALPRARVITREEAYLHLEIRSLLFRFVDDLELQWHEDQGVAAVRSASRAGHSDLGVNFNRVEALRSSVTSWE